MKLENIFTIGNLLGHSMFFLFVVLSPWRFKKKSFHFFIHRKDGTYFKYAFFYLFKNKLHLPITLLDKIVIFANTYIVG